MLYSVLRLEFRRFLLYFCYLVHNAISQMRCRCRFPLARDQEQVILPSNRINRNFSFEKLFEKRQRSRKGGSGHLYPFKSI
jgi:hypothetical protein